MPLDQAVRRRREMRAHTLWLAAKGWPRAAKEKARRHRAISPASGVNKIDG